MNGRWILIAVIGVMVMLIGATGLVLYQLTVINKPLFFGLTGVAALLAGGATAVCGMLPVPGVQNRILTGLICFIAAGITVGSGWIIINYITAPTADAIPEKAIVDRKYTKTRYHSRRTGRRTYSRGAPYKVYDVDVRMENGITWDLEIPRSKYEALRKGDTVTIRTARGALGMRVVDSRSVTPLHPRKRSGSGGGRCKFFGTTGSHTKDSARSDGQH